MKFKVVLINPPRENVVLLDIQRGGDLGEFSSFPPVGLMYLAKALTLRNPGFDVSIIDSVAEKLTSPQLAARVAAMSPDLAGVSAMTYTFYDSLQTAKEIKKAIPSVPVVIGGAHMYIFAADTMSAHHCFDYGIAGDGEDVFAGLCEQLSRNEEPQPAQGLYMRRGGSVTGSGSAVIKDIDAVPVPAIELINSFAYFSPIGKKNVVGTICSTRGCPFRCTFCQVPHRNYFMRSIKNVTLEIEEYIARGVSDFFFFDDLFNITKKRVVEFSEEVLRKNLKIGWMFRGRIDQIDNAMLKIARRAGCHTISVGIEAATDQGLREIKKNITIDQSLKAVRLIRANGIRCSANWIIGLPSQKTQDDLQHLLKTAMKIDSDYAEFSILQCLPGSELYGQAVSEGGIPADAWLNYVLSPSPKFSPPVWEKHFSKDELFAFYEYSNKKYYLRPKVILREILRVRSPKEFIVKFKTAKSIFIDRYFASRKNKEN